MSKQDDWTNTLENLGVFVGAGMPLEEAQEVFASIHGFRPDGKPVHPVRRRWWRRKKN